MKYTLGLFLLLILLNSSCQNKNTNDITDNFETDTLSAIWTNDKFIPGALEMQSEIVRSGKKAAKLTLRSGDQIDEEKGSIFERAELKEPKKMMAIEKNNYSYSFSLFLPSDFPVSSTRLVIAQWKQNCSSGNCDPDNPLIALRYESGVLRITLQTSPDRKTLYTVNESILNKWIDFRFDIRYSRNPDGKLIAWMNGKEIINFEGETAYREEYGYPLPGNFYFKMGLYRDTMPETMTIYIDDYKKEQIKEF